MSVSHSVEGVTLHCLGLQLATVVHVLLYRDGGELEGHSIQSLKQSSFMRRYNKLREALEQEKDYSHCMQMPEPVSVTTESLVKQLNDSEAYHNSSLPSLHTGSLRQDRESCLAAYFY